MKCEWQPTLWSAEIIEEKWKLRLAQVSSEDSWNGGGAVYSTYQEAPTLDDLKNRIDPIKFSSTSVKKVKMVFHYLGDKQEHIDTSNKMKYQEDILCHHVN